jgi:fructose/tagatose bisphosphate aldolase
MLFDNLGALKKALSNYLTITKDGIKGLKQEDFVERFIDDLAYNTVFNPDKDVVEACRWLIWCTAHEMGIWAASINDLYFARGRGEYADLTVPAVNIRGLTYDVAQSMFNVINRNKIGTFIFEIARSEIGYTAQRPAEYTACVLAAAIKSGYKGPVCLQGDHFQFKAKTYKENPEKEIEGIKALVQEALEAGFYNIDIDASTLVDLDFPTLEEQQRLNYEMTSLVTDFVRKREPKGVTVSLGGEIGEVGGKNSTVEEMRVFMSKHHETLRMHDPKMVGISKISVQTGTSHGGVVLPDGSIAKVAIDFDTLEKISKAAVKEFGIAGAVQHGASTLPKEAFDKFPQTQTCEIHLATGFQNIIYDHEEFPAELKKEVYAWLSDTQAAERKAGQTDEQFYYKTRKKGFGPFKQKMWDLPAKVKKPILKALEDEFATIFGKLNVSDSRDLAHSKLKEVFVPKPRPHCIK